MYIILRCIFCTYITDVPRHSLESSALNTKRKDSSNSISSVKEPDIPEPKNDMFSLLSKDKVIIFNSVLQYMQQCLLTSWLAKLFSSKQDQKYFLKNFAQFTIVNAQDVENVNVAFLHAQLGAMPSKIMQTNLQLLT